MDLELLHIEKDFEKLQGFFKKHIPYSDFSPVSLFCWSHGKEIYYNLSDNGLVLKIPDYFKPEYIYGVYLVNLKNDFFENFLNLSKTVNFVPEESLNFFDAKFKKTADEDSFDYIYLISELIYLSNPSASSLNKKFKKFEKSYDLVTYEKIDLKNNKLIESLFDLTYTWCKQKNFDETSTNNEIYALQTYIKLSSRIEDLSVGIYYKDKLIAFTLNEKVSADWSMGHFGKSLYSFKYSSIASEVYTARFLHSFGIKYLNHQQDTGILSLRAFKRALGPYKNLKKYTVELI